MASRAGPRAHGTDGSDFKNRERVAPQYNQGPMLKKRIKFLFSLHLAVWTVIFVKILPEILLRFGHKTRFGFTKWPFPRSELWEFMWVLGTIPPILFGFSSLNRNRINLMRITLIGIVSFGFFPIFWGSLSHLTELVDYYHTRNYKYSISGFPLILIFYIFFSVCFQIHGFTIYFGFKLTNMWSHNIKKTH